MSSRLILLAVLGLALVQASFAGKLHAASSTHQLAGLLNIKSYLDHAISDIQAAENVLELQTVPPQVSCLIGNDASYLSYGKASGQFGTSDFSVGIWVQTSDKSVSLFDVIGNRYAGSHGNFFQIRMTSDGTPRVEIDQDGNGLNYAIVYGRTGLTDGNWHHLVATRQGTTLTLYVDGVSVGSSKSTGLTNINGAYDFRIGRSLAANVVPGRYSATACYSGPNVALRAWSATEVAAKYKSTRP